MKEAAVMLIIKDGLILGISRKDDPSLFGLAGGKLEEGETPSQAAIRETKEETAVTVYCCEPVYVREEPPRKPGGLAFHTHCFYATAWSGIPENSEEGEVRWLTVKELTETMAAFPDYNKKTLVEFRTKFPHVKLKEE